MKDPDSVRFRGFFLFSGGILGGKFADLFTLCSLIKWSDREPAFCFLSLAIDRVLAIKVMTVCLATMPEH